MRRTTMTMMMLDMFMMMDMGMCMRSGVNGQSSR